MKNKLTKSNLIIAQRGVSLVVVFAVLVVSLLAVIPLSYGWFAKNNKVTASGMHTQAYKTDFDISYKVLNTMGDSDEYESATLANLFYKENRDSIRAPGDSIEIQITIKNKSSKYAVDFTGFGFEAPTVAEEVPKIDSEGNIRYLSTELYTQLISVSVNEKDATQETLLYSSTWVEYPATSDKVHFLRGGTSTEPASAGRVDFVLDLPQATTISVPVGGSVTFTIRVSFANTNEDQNIYKNFATTGGKCEREFFFTYEDQLED
jgi:hypothetical protein